MANQSTSKKTAIVTGGTSGIGLGIVKMCLSRGIPVFIISNGINTNATSNLESELSGTQASWTYHQADVLDWDELESAFKKAMTWSSELGGKLWFVFANAGIGERKWLDLSKDVPEKADGMSFQKPNYDVFDVNVKGSLNTAALAVQAMRISPELINTKDRTSLPRVVITASICGYYALPGLPSYTAAKHAIIGFTRSYAPQALADHGIHLHAICPNVVETNISTATFYSSIRDIDHKLLTPVEYVVNAASDLVEAEGNLSTIYEVGPKGIKARDNDFIKYMDDETISVCGLLMNRGLNLYESSVPRRT